MHAINRSTHPWILKDPRLCLMMKQWVDILQQHRETHFAVLLTYRNPLEVARSLQRRKRNQIPNLVAGLQLWIFYNRMAVWQSRKMCRVVTR